MPGHEDEVQRLAITMNRMLEKLQQSADRQQEFIADASHELRSPLASLRAQLEVSAAHPEGMDVRELATDSLADVQRLQDLTEDLLLFQPGKYLHPRGRPLEYQRTNHLTGCLSGSRRGTRDHARPATCIRHGEP